MYEEIQKQLYEEFKINALLHGAEIKEEGQVGKETQQTQPQDSLFPDPSIYEDLSEEEKKQKTKELMDRHRNFFKGKMTINNA